MTESTEVYLGPHRWIVLGLAYSAGVPPVINRPVRLEATREDYASLTMAKIGECSRETWQSLLSKAELVTDHMNQ